MVIGPLRISQINTFSIETTKHLLCLNYEHHRLLFFQLVLSPSIPRSIGHRKIVFVNLYMSPHNTNKKINIATLLCLKLSCFIFYNCTFVIVHYRPTMWRFQSAYSPKRICIFQTKTVCDVFLCSNAAHFSKSWIMPDHDQVSHVRLRRLTGPVL